MTGNNEQIRVGDRVEAHYQGRPDGRITGEVVKKCGDELLIQHGVTNDKYGRSTVPLMTHIFGTRGPSDVSSAPGVIVKKA